MSEKLIGYNGKIAYVDLTNKKWETNELDPNIANTWYNKAMALEKLKRGAEAIDAYSKVLLLNPNIGEAWLNKGRLLRNADKLKEAVECYDKAEELEDDLLDLEQDRRHPEKNSRPLARGTIKPATALAASVIIAGVALALSFGLNTRFGLIVTAYFLLGMLYSKYLKHVVIIDVMTIAGFFVLRVAGGAAAVEVGVSQWLFLCTVLLALFIGFGKRRHELVMLEEEAGEHREILDEYRTGSPPTGCRPATAGPLVRIHTAHKLTLIAHSPAR